jgi:quercetin dioxygenase-like cupin family protein
MKIILAVCFNLLVLMFYCQEFVGEFNKVRPDSAFENIHIHQISSDINSTTFAIWVKRKVKIHKHTNHIENIYVTQGEGRFHLGATTYHVETGDLIVVPKNTWHGIEVTSTVPLRVISIQSPEFIGIDRIFKD